MNMTIIKSELYKIITKKYLWIFLLILSLAFSFITLQMKEYTSVKYSFEPFKNELQQAMGSPELYKVVKDNEYNAAYSEIKQYLPSSVIEYIEKYRTVMNDERMGEQGTVAVYLENNLASKVCNYFERKDDRINEISNTEKKIMDLIANGKENGFEYLVQTKILESFKKANFIQLNLGRWNQFININIGWLIPSSTILLILLGLAGIYSDEYVNKTQSSLLTAKKGRQGIFVSKLVAGVLYSFFCVILFQIVCLVVTGYVYGLPYNDISLVSLFGFKLTPYTWSAMEFYCIQLGGSLLTAFVMASMTMFFSVSFKSALLPFFLSGSYYGATFLLAKMINFSGNVTTLFSLPAELSPFLLQSMGDFGAKGRFANLFGLAVPTLYLNIVFHIFIAVLALVFCYRGYVRKQVKN